jgi:hypothetical protein
VYSSQTVIFGLWWASVALQAVVCIRLAITGLWRSYRRLVWYLGGLAIESCVLLAISNNVALYRKAWVVTRLILLYLEVLAVLEIFRRWSASYRGIGKFGQQLLGVLCVLAMGLLLATVPIAWSSSGWNFTIYAMSVGNRAVHAGLAAFLILMLGFFLKFGGPVAPNLWRHTWAMTIFASANALSYFVVTAGRFAVGVLLLQGISTATLVYWLLALRKAGEEIPVTPNNAELWAEADELNRQLLGYADSFKRRMH